ncbi:pentapeptide repeat-containing protein [Spirosoma sp.]|uniref:pentapeptide repeat-containing protein n=1 Tax=Spirosoma sp. TaxID=1899569 RepID=UPI0026127896|nr:pentapeptide repeat-containing protein [Spirosoma sp.]MCX6213747.1 pentapeptide repeat-containing protein [Spirosoma sp.]
MTLVSQLDLFAQQPQLIRYDLSGTNYSRFTVDDADRPDQESGQIDLRNDRGEVLVSLQSRRNRSVSEQARRRLLLETAFSQGRVLAGLQLPGLKLVQVHLVGTRRMDLTGASLTKALVTAGRMWADLRGSTLTDLAASGVDWHGSQLADCQLTGARVTGSNFQSVSFCRSNLEKAHFLDCQLQMSYLSWCHLHQASLKGSDLSGCDLRYTDLTGCDVRGTYLRGISISVAALEKANLKPIRQRIQHLVLAYPLLKPVWVAALEAGHWQAGSAESLSDFLSRCLGYRVGAGWQNVPGSTEWIIWQFLRSIQTGERPTSHSLANLLYKWVSL